MRFKERIEKVMHKGMDISREALEKTKEAGEKGALKLKIMRLENDAQKKLAELGGEVYELFVEKGEESVSADAETIRAILDAVGKIEKEIAENEEKLKSI